MNIIPIVGTWQGVRLRFVWGSQIAWNPIQSRHGAPFRVPCSGLGFRVPCSVGRGDRLRLDVSGLQVSLSDRGIRGLQEK